jgi:nucleotide-binding universal stress UspA family protein
MHFHPRKILLPIDFSPSSAAALEAGLDLARHFDAEIILLTVVPMFSQDKISDEFIPTGSPDSVKSADLKELAQYASEMLSQGIKASSRIEVGDDVVGNILLTVNKEQIDLLIISTHGSSGWREDIFGSIAEHVVRQVECPLFLLRSPKTPAKVDHVDGNAASAVLV